MFDMEDFDETILKNVSFVSNDLKVPFKQNHHVLKLQNKNFEKIEMNFDVNFEFDQAWSKKQIEINLSSSDDSDSLSDESPLAQNSYICFTKSMCINLFITTCKVLKKVEQTSDCSMMQTI